MYHGIINCTTKYTTLSNKVTYITKLITKYIRYNDIYEKITMAPVKLGYVRPKHLDIYHLFVSKKGLPYKVKIYNNGE